MKLSEKDQKLAIEGYNFLVGAVETENKPVTTGDSRKSAVKGKGLSKAKLLRGRGISKIEELTNLKKTAPKTKDESDFKIVLNKGRLVFSLGGKKELPLPKPVTDLFVTALEKLARGEDVSLTNSPEEPNKKVVTTQQAADYLKVSRPFLVRLLEEGKIPFHKVGAHRRISFEDLQNYKERIDAKRLDTLAELAKQAQELGMGY